MSDRPRFVFDANVVVSAALFEHSTSGQAFYAALDRGQILLSCDVVEELDDVLSRQKFDRYLTREERELFLQILLREALLVEVSESIQVCRDPKDDKYLSLAVAGRATSVVSGDQDLLVLGLFRGIPILSPAQFLDFISKRNEGSGA